MKAKNLVYVLIGSITSGIIVLNLFIGIPSNYVVGDDISTIPIDLGGYEYSIGENTVEELVGYRVSNQEVNSRVRKISGNIMSYIRYQEVIDNTPGENLGEKDNVDSSNINSGSHNAIYKSLTDGMAKGYSKESSSITDVKVGDLLSEHKNFLTLPLKKEFMKTTSGFGVRKDPINSNSNSGKLPFHTGIDLAGEGINGSSIYAISHGRVSLIQKSDSGYGNLVIVDHGNGLESYYAHMSNISEDIREGDLISAGTVLGFVGSTGRSTGPHLHLEINIDGVAIDPQIFIDYMREGNSVEFIDQEYLDKNKISPIEVSKSMGGI